MSDQHELPLDAAHADWARYLSPDTPEQDAVAFALFDVAWSHLDDIEVYLNGQDMRVDSGSSLYLDARHLGPYRGGGLHRSALSSSFDALRTVRLILDTQDRIIPMTGLYPLLRSGLENAALATYLLAPDERDERLLRAWREIAGEVRLQHKFRAQFDRSAADVTRTRWWRELDQMMLTRPNIPRPSKPLQPEPITSMMSAADIHVTADPAAAHLEHAMPLLAIWQLLSGLAHGRHWAAFAALAQSDPIPTADESIVTVQMTTRPSVVAMALLRAVMTLEAATRLYGRRAKRWTRQPEDSAEEPASAT